MLKIYFPPDLCSEKESLQILLQVCSPSIPPPLHLCLCHGGFIFIAVFKEFPHLWWSSEFLCCDFLFKWIQTNEFILCQQFPFYVFLVMKIAYIKDAKVLHTVGLAVLVFLALPDIDSARVLMLTARWWSSALSVINNVDKTNPQMSSSL